MKLYEIFSFFALGFLGGFGHCIGMCHPFVLYISNNFHKQSNNYFIFLKPHILYNLGRISMYSFLGLLTGLLGGIANLAGNIIGLQKLSAIIAGIFLISYAVLIMLKSNYLITLEEKFTNTTFTNFLKKLQPKNPFTFGLILGLLPCGLLYSALIASTGKGDILASMLSMLSFGIGTSIALLVLAIFGNLIRKFQKIFNILSIILMLGMGLFFIYSGIKF
ncbi:sulfite exporter TauE/SafE family protein [Deferribacter thermophilus]|uniref:sulfite exporter TauE/SafE family protein n=1 Tax=Deferribacter thermophilus TaxID=53573 RepID=UPI003C29DCCF